MFSLAYHWIEASETHDADAVNHFTAAVNKATGTIDAIYNDKTWTCQIFTDGYQQVKLGSGYRKVKYNKANDARCIFKHLTTTN